MLRVESWGGCLPWYPSSHPTPLNPTPPHPTPPPSTPPPFRIRDGAIVPLVADGRTVVVATHQISFCARPHVSRVAILRSGAIVACAPWAEIRHFLPDVPLAERIPKAGIALEAGIGAGAADEADDRVGCRHEGAPRFEEVNADPNVEAPAESPPTVHMASLVSRAAAARHLRSVLHKLEGRRIDSALIARTCATLLGNGEADERAETKAEGLIRAADFNVYLRSFGTWLTLGLLVVATILAAILSIGDGVYLAEWTRGDRPNVSTGSASPRLSTSPTSTPSQTVSLLIYISIGFASQVFAAMQTILLTLCALRASRALHSTVLDALMKAPMYFFDLTPSGAVLNRLLSDMQARERIFHASGDHFALYLCPFLVPRN